MCQGVMHDCKCVAAAVARRGVTRCSGRVGSSNNALTCAAAPARCASQCAPGWRRARLSAARHLQQRRRRTPLRTSQQNPECWCVGGSVLTHHASTFWCARHASLRTCDHDQHVARSSQCLERGLRLHLERALHKHWTHAGAATGSSASTQCAVGGATQPTGAALTHARHKPARASICMGSMPAACIRPHACTLHNQRAHPQHPMTDTPTHTPPPHTNTWKTAKPTNAMSASASSRGSARSSGPLRPAGSCLCASAMTRAPCAANCL